MRIRHNLWRVSNGWLLVPEEKLNVVTCDDAANCFIFKTLKEFSDQYPMRERRKRSPKPTTPTPKETVTNANIN